MIDKLAIVVPPAEEGYEAYVSSDVGNVTWAVPTGSFRYACFVPGGVGHSWQQVSSGGTTIGTKGAIGAAKVLYLSAVELMTDAKLLASVRAEFLERRGPDFVFEPMMGNRRPPFLPAATLDPTLPEMDLKPAFVPVAVPVATPQADTTSLDIFLRSAGIQDQAESGRCWYFATANVLRGDLEFSVVYPYFWDMMEKANLFLVNVWDHRKEAVDSRYNETLFRRPTWDGGHFMNAVYLIDKYGVVPSSAMPETEVSQNTGTLLRDLRRLLRAYGMKMRETTDPEVVRKAAMRDVSSLLVAALGTPPETFEFEGKTYTPASFRDTFVAPDLSDRYVMLMNDPRRPYYRMYRVEGSRNAADGTDWTFLNLPCDELEALGIASLEAGDRFYFTCDTNEDALPEAGIYDSRLFPRDPLPEMTKSELFDSRDISSAHAMAMCGVKRAPDGTVQYWISENSFGLVRGADGYVQLDAGWWRRFMFRMAIDRRYLSEDQLRMTGGSPETIPYWNLY